MQVMNVWDYQVWDGGSYQNHKAYFDATTVSDQDAKNLAGKYDSMDAKEIIVYSSIQEYQDELNGVVKKRALAKLTIEERKALGY